MTEIKQPEIKLPEIAKTYNDLNKRLLKNEFGPEELFARIQQIIVSISRLLALINLGHKVSASNSEAAKSTSEPDQLTMEIIIRVMKMGFIETISKIEFYSKKQLKETNQEYFKNLQDKQNQEKYIYLSQIIKDAEDSNKISKEDKKLWDFIIHIRNCLVHNGGFSDRDMETLIGEIEVKKNKEIEGVIMDFYRITEKPIELYSKLLKIF